MPSLFRTLSLAALLATPGLLAQEPKEAAATKQPIKDKQVLIEEAQQAAQDQDWTKAAALFKQVTEIDPKNGRAWHMLGYSLHAAGKLDDALPIHLKTAEFPNTKPTGLYNAACVYALKKDKKNAFEYLDKAIDAGFTQLETLENDTDFDAVRKEPEFEKLVAKARAAAKDPKNARPPQIFAPTTDRRCARFAMFSSAREKAGQFSIDYGAPAWKDSNERLIEENSKDSPRWRFGKDFWTTLDTNRALEIGGVPVPVGQYYLTMQRKDGKFLLQCHDPAEARKLRLDAFQAPSLKGGLEIPCEYAKAEKSADKLTIKVEPDSSGETVGGTILIHYGPHQLRAPFKISE